MTCAAIETVILYNRKERRGRSNLPGPCIGEKKCHWELVLKRCFIMKDGNMHKDPDYACVFYIGLKMFTNISVSSTVGKVAISLLGYHSVILGPGPVTNLA